MEQKEFEEKMRQTAEQINILLNEEQLTMFFQYMNLLVEWNEKMNLTAITKPEEIILKHFIDSLTIASELEEGCHVVDVGTGAGFPGIPLCILRKDLKMTLLDSLNKRVLFLEEVVKQLKLENIKTIHARAEEAGSNQKYREQFDVATSRAVANLSTLAEYLMPFVRVQGKSICMKGSEIEEEVETSKKAIRVLGGTIQKIEKFNLPRKRHEKKYYLYQKNRKNTKSLSKKTRNSF